MDINDIVDQRERTPGERFREDWLDMLPENQWPSYIDDSAQLVADGIFIGDTDLTKADFGYETGEFYQRGLATSAELELDATSLPIGNHTATEIGTVAWVFNKLYEELRSAQYANFENPSRAVEAAINKALVESIGQGAIQPDELETIRLPESATVSTLMSEVFCRPRSEAYLSLLLETVEEVGTSGLLEHIESPRMVTTLWEHQREGLTRWLANDCRGYVDMATATGKTVLGLAAVAHHFGELHPSDRHLTEEPHQFDGNGRATVLIVAHRDLILDQWKREFDQHLNIPEQSSTQTGEHTIEFEWGDVHFWTPDRLSEVGVPDTDLVVLDETHHYLGSSGFGELLDDIEGDVLALSGSLDDANARTLERRDIPELFTFSLQDGQEAGVIPQCDWDVVFSPYENQTQLAEITANCRRGFERYADGIAVPDAVEPDTDRLTFTTMSEARSIAQSSVGRALKERDDQFREFSSAVMGRQLTQYNLSPALSTIVHLTLDQIDQHKCVVLLETHDEIARVTDALREQLGEAYDQVVTVLNSDDDISTVRAFDQEQEHGAIIGVARTLGEGIDIQTADVCINRGRGRLSRSLIQRMGRILRNPDGQKHAQFFHISGIPTRDDATLLDEDGVGLLETASQLLCWGESFDARPVFRVDTETPLQEQDLVTLEQAGAQAIERWQPDHYDWPSDTDVAATLRELCDTLETTDDSALLAIERPTTDAAEPESIEEPEVPDERQSVQFVAARGDGVVIPEWLYAVIAELSEERPDAFVEQAVRSQLRHNWTVPEPAEPATEQEQLREVSLNPALEAVVHSYADDRAPEELVSWALATAVLEQDQQDLSQQVATIPSEELHDRLTGLTAHS